MAISEENKAKLAINDRGIAFPLKLDSPPNSPSEGRKVDEVGSFNTVTSAESELVWAPKETDAATLGTPNVIGVGPISADILDSELIITIHPQTVRLSGRYGFDTFHNITYSFKVPTTNDSPQSSVVTKTGFPIVLDPNLKNLMSCAIDTRETRDANYTVDFIVEFDYSSPLDSPPNSPFTPPSTVTNSDGTYQLYVDSAEEKAYRKDRFVFNQTIRNFTGEQIGGLFRDALDAVLNSPPDSPL